jgi:hypothetical protein
MDSFRPPTKTKNVTLLRIVQTDSGAHPVSYSVRAGGYTRPGHEAHRSAPSSAVVKNGGVTAPKLPTPSWHIGEIIKHGDNHFQLVK